MSDIPRIPLSAPAATPAAASAARSCESPTGFRKEIAVAALGVAGATLAVWVTLRADFLAFPGWLAVQKADIVLGPVLVGLYWRRRRPASRFGPMLIGLGLIGIPYILQSSSRPALFGLGVAWELVIYLATLAVILAFPTGRLDGLAERLILVSGALFVVAPSLAAQLAQTRFGPNASISACVPACPANGLTLGSSPAVSSTLIDIGRVGLVGVALAASGLIVWRYISGSPPRRRALAVGAPVSLLFLVMQAVYQGLGLAQAEQVASRAPIRWSAAAAHSLLWYGWLLALVVAELFAARVLTRIVGESLRPPSPRKLQSMLREPLGDPQLELAFWNAPKSAWKDAGGMPIPPPEPAPGQAMIKFALGREPAVAILHDAHLSDDPELLEAAGAVALLARENADLEAAWDESLRELGESRARIATATDAERRKLERDLHDGAQQRLLAVLLKLDLVAERAAHEPEIRRQLLELEEELEAAIDELRELGHGIYPTVLANSGLAGALRALAARSGGRLTFGDSQVRELPTEIEAAFYYCCLEAVHNATKHAGPQATIVIRLTADGREVRLKISDNGRGFDPDAPGGGVGLRNMRDRLGGVRGRVAINSAPTRGTTVTATAPLGP